MKGFLWHNYTWTPDKVFIWNQKLAEVFDGPSYFLNLNTKNLVEVTLTPTPTLK